MRLISLSFALLAITLLAGCPGNGSGASCGVAADCAADTDPCTVAACEQGVCEQNPITTGPECGMACTTAAECGDGVDCTGDSCTEGVCVNAPILGCGACEPDDDCDDGDPCTDDGCGGDNLCGHSPHVSAACDMCEPNGTCQDEEACFCADCVEHPNCVQEADCIEVLALDVTQFGEGPITDADGNDLEGAGTDIVQVFDNDLPDGTGDFVTILDHDDCFAAGGGCAQLRINFNSTPIEAMFTSGSWHHNADDSGEIAGATAYEYTQGAGGVMTYVPDGLCYWIEYFHYEP